MCVSVYVIICIYMSVLLCIVCPSMPVCVCVCVCVCIPEFHGVFWNVAELRREEGRLCQLAPRWAVPGGHRLGVWRALMVFVFMALSARHNESPGTAHTSDT